MSAPLRILIIGQNGQVSRALQSRLSGLGELTVRGSDQLDLAQPDCLRARALDRKSVV